MISSCTVSQYCQYILPRCVSEFRGEFGLMKSLIMFLTDNKSHLRQTTQKIEPLPETVKKIQKSVVWKMENELYNYALSRFHAVKKRLINASMKSANQRFFYEKIRPK